MKTRFLIRFACASLVALLNLNLALGDGTNGGWTSLGAMAAPKWDGKALLFHGEQGMLAVTPLSPDVVRVRFTTKSYFGRDHSYAVVSHDLGAINANAKIGVDSTTLTTSSLKIIIQYSPLRISFANTNGEMIDADDAREGVVFVGLVFCFVFWLFVFFFVFG